MDDEGIRKLDPIFYEKVFKPGPQKPQCQAVELHEFEIVKTDWKPHPIDPAILRRPVKIKANGMNKNKDSYIWSCGTCVEKQIKHSKAFPTMFRRESPCFTHREVNHSMWQPMKEGAEWKEFEGLPSFERRKQDEKFYYRCTQCANLSDSDDPFPRLKNKEECTNLGIARMHAAVHSDDGRFLNPAPLVDDFWPVASSPEPDGQ